jgi:UDP-N-acetylglucosamine 1-carboxyvinyltransferase
MPNRLIIEGGKKLNGQIKISGSKNAALAIMAATILAHKKVTLENLPHLTDIATMSHLLISLGSKLSFRGNGNGDDARGKTMNFDSKSINNLTAEYNIVSKMRASILVLGPLLAKYGKAIVSLPGGCAIGSRPVDLHLKALEKLGAKIEIKEGYVIAEAKSGLIGNEIEFSKISVGATENIIMAATIAKGTSIIKNAAIEPEVIDLINFLKLLGAKIEVSERKITVTGVKNLHGGTYKITPDRIEAGSYAVATIATKGKVFFPNIELNIFAAIKKELEALGGVIKKKNNGVEISYKKPNKVNNLIIETAEYPGFPTDMQAQFTAALLNQTYNSTIYEKIFENRFMHIEELKRMSANLNISDNNVKIEPSQLTGTKVIASDLRASMALIIAGLIAKGRTTIYKIHHLDRGYELLEEKLARCGAKIYREYY